MLNFYIEIISNDSEVYNLSNENDLIGNIKLANFEFEHELNHHISLLINTGFISFSIKSTSETYFLNKNLIDSIKIKNLETLPF